MVNFSGYAINGCHYQTKDRDAVRVSQNSGVTVVAKTLQVASMKDNNPIISDMSFYGVIKEIWLLDYFHCQIPVFKCDWVDSKNSVKVDELGFILVELGRVGHKSDSFVLPSQAKQVFYVPDQLDDKCSIVCSTPQRIYYDEDNADEGIDCFVTDETHNKVPDFELFDDVDESPSTYLCEDCEGTWIANSKS